MTTTPKLIRYSSPAGPYWYHPDHPDCQDGAVLHEEPEDWTLPEATGIEAEVIRDIADRQRLGIKKYGCTVADSLDDMCQHAYEEALDLAIYLKAELTHRANDPNYKHYTHHQPKP
jgi:hypothetical protein